MCTRSRLWHWERPLSAAAWRLHDGRTAVVTSRPFLAPHHTISDVGLIGGGQVPLPGEVSHVHHGVTLLVNVRQSISNAMGVRFARGIGSVSLAFKWRM
jgi:Magnesium chelatase, subunit ChlI